MLLTRVRAAQQGLCTPGKRAYNSGREETSILRQSGAFCKHLTITVSISNLLNFVWGETTIKLDFRKLKVGKF